MIKFFQQKNKKSERGFTLIETLVAVLILSIAITGMMTVLSRGLINIKYAKNKMIATYLAQEGLEYALKYKEIVTWPMILEMANNNWCGGGSKICAFDVFSTANTYAEYADEPCPLCFKLYLSSNDGGYRHQNDTGYVSSDIYSGFSRKVKFIKISNDEVNVSVSVSWNKDLNSVTLSENFYNLAP